jgi:uncharacterized protein YjdB
MLLMGLTKTVMFIIVACLCIVNKNYAQTPTRISIASITPSISTGQNYSPWLNDDVTNLIANVWTSSNMQYIDVKIKLQTKATVSKLRLYDFEGTFEANPCTIYAVNGTTKTLLGTFLGLTYMNWVDMNISTPVLADTIVVHKYGNCIPHKVQIYGVPATTTTGTTTGTTTTGTGTVTGTTGTGTGTTTTGTLTTLPTATSGLSLMCAGASALYSNTTAGGTWSSSNSAVATVSASGMVTGVSGGTAMISYIAAGQLATKMLTVNPMPNAGSISGSATVCKGGTAVYSNSATGGAWSSSSSSVAPINSSGTVTGKKLGTATIRYTATNSCGSSTATKMITVSLTPVVSAISGTPTVSVGATAALTNSTPGGIWSSTAPGIATVNSSGTVTGISAGASTISYKVTQSCGTAYATKAITVNPSAATTAGTITGTATVCAGGTTALANTTPGGSWSSLATGIATVSTTGMVTGVAAGTATIKYTVGTAIATKVVTVNAMPSAGTISGTATVPAGSTTVLSSSVAGGTWSSSATGIATVGATGIVTGVAAGAATISYKVTNTCGTATATKLVSVNTTTTTTTVGTITGATTVCVGSTTALSNATPGGIWSSSATGTATVSTTGIVTGISTGAVTISYSVGGSSAFKVITINATPVAGTISGTATVSAGSTTALSSSATGGAWSSSSTSVATVGATGTVNGITVGTSTISYTVSNSCGTATATKVVTVNATSGTGTGGGGTSVGTLVYGKIPMDGKRWYQLNNCSNGLEGLHDNNLSTSVSTGWGKILANYDAYYPVLAGERINIDSIKFYDGAGSNETAPFKLYYIDSAWNRVLIGTYIGTQYNMWVGPNAATPTNYASIPARNVRYLVINCSGTYPNEMALYGSYVAPNVLPVAAPKTIKLKQELGVNAFEWDFEHPSSPLIINETRMKAVKSFSCIRHYLDWQKLEPTNGGYTYNPSHSGGWNLDTIYARCKAEGIEMLVDIKTQPTWMQASYPSGTANDENVPVMYGADFTNPSSYLKQAKMGFQFAARYGYNASVSSSLLSVNPATRWTGDPANYVRKGLGYVKYIECDNERDKWWKGRNAYQTGREYAANLSAFYDGHKNTMGAGVGVKNADPSMQVVMGGVAMPTIDYLMGMIDWCKEFRGYKSDGTVNLCWDIINYHIYSDNGGSRQGLGTRGAAPEVARIDTFAKNFIDAAHTYAHDMPVWVTETGYDVNQGSPVKAIAIGSKSIKQTQADWVLRTSLMHARHGVERTFFYMMDDVDTNSTIKFSSCGLINADYSRKPAADFLNQTNKLMGEYVYKETISTNPVVDRYELDGRSAYVLVKPTENGSTMPYTLTVGTTGTVRIYKPTLGQDTMSLSTMAASGGGVTLTVTETPQFVIPVYSASKVAKTEASDAPIAAAQPAIDVTVFPNPTSGSVYFTIENEKQSDVQVTMYTESGQVVKSYNFSKAPGKMTEAIDISSMPNGLYLMELGMGNDKVVKKIIKVN